MSPPPFVSEFPDAYVTDCVPSSGLMGVNKETHNRYPATITEREALQNAMGTQNQGATHLQLAAGIKKRYGLTVPAGAGWPIIAAALKDPAQGVAVFGSYQKLPAAIRTYGNQPTFDGGHCIYALYRDAANIYVGDPLASSYSVAKIVDLQAYSLGLGQLFVTFKEQALAKLYGLAGWPDYARTSLKNAQGYAYRIFANAGMAPKSALPGRWGASGWPWYARLSYASASAYALRVFLNNPNFKL